MSDTTVETKPGYAKCCATCPWLVENHGKKHENGWYTKTNLKRLWGGLKNGENMICHATDPESIEYGGSKEVKPGHERACVGGLVLVKRSFHGLEVKGDLAAYRAQGSGIRMTRTGFMRWVDRIVFNIRPGLMPQPDMNQPVGVPWEDDILNSTDPKINHD